MSNENYWEKGFVKCPDCGHEKFIKGPSGGRSVNFKCGECGAKFNSLGPFGVERIGGEEGCRRSNSGKV